MVESEIWQKSGPAQILLHHGNAADGEVTGGTAANLEEADAGALAVLLVPVYEEHHDLYALDDHVRVILTADDVGGEDVTGGAVFPGGADDGNVLFTGGYYPAVLGVNLIVLLQDTAADHLIDELVGEISLTLSFCLVPNLHEVLFQTAESFFLGDAGVGYTVVVVVDEFLLLLRSEVTVAGHTIIVVVGHQVHDVFLQVIGAAADEGNLVLADHLGQGEAEFCGTHGAGHGQEHLATLVQKVFIGFCSVYQRCGIEVTVVVGNELRDRSLFHFIKYLQRAKPVFGLQPLLQIANLGKIM